MHGQSNASDSPKRAADDRKRQARRRVKLARKANRQRRPRRTTGVRS
jgi:hypothetical protein